MLSPSRFRHMLEIIARHWVYVFWCVLLLPRKKWEPHLAFIDVKKKKKQKDRRGSSIGSGLCREVCVLGRRSSVHHSPSTWLHRRPGQGKDAIQAPRSPADWTASFREPTAIGPLRYQLRCKTTKRTATNRNRSLLVGWLYSLGSFCEQGNNIQRKRWEYVSQENATLLIFVKTAFAQLRLHVTWLNTTWENLQIEKHKSVRWAERTPSWFVLFDLQIFWGSVYPPSATSRTISFSISNSFWY